LVLQAFIDESGTNPSDDVFVLAGFISTPEKWEELSSAWHGLMRDWEIRYFHMADFESRHGQFSNWDEESRRVRLQSLLTLIQDYAVASVSVALPEANFREVYGDKANPDLKYLIAGRQLLWEVSFFDQNGERLEVHNAETERYSYVFESGARGAGKLQTLFRAFYNNPLYRLLFRLDSFTFGAKEEHRPLQSADILAYEGFRHWSRQFGPDSRSIRYPWVELSKVPHTYANMGVEGLQKGHKGLLEEIEKLGL
jgi:hypothetical protein